MITYNWHIIATVWEGRNEKMHHTETIHDLSGMPQVKEAIRAEWYIGLGRLPASQFSHHFSLALDKLLLKPYEYQKTWLATIRQGRILLDPSNLCQDEISDSDTLQKWLGISYKVSDKEGEPILKDAIQAEKKLGMGCLPSRYNKYFHGTTATLMNKSVKFLKSWLTEVRKGREQYDNDNLLLDDFSTPGALKDWMANK